MEYTFLIASLVAAFIAGIAALFAPCCITVLLPSYLASIFRQKRTVVAMTFVFFLGLLAVFLPLGLGFAAIGVLFTKNHDWIFGFGGIAIFLLGISMLLGFHFSLPFTPHSKSKITGSGSVFLLGVFSAFATLCCAPVLAGVLALSILPGSFFWGGLYSLAYVAGMVAPLFLIAFYMDKYNLSAKFKKMNKPVLYSIFGKQVSMPLSEAIAGGMFFILGLLIIYLAWTGRLQMEGNEFQTSINIFMSNMTSSINYWLAKIPPYIFAIIAAAIFSLIAALMVKKFSKKN